MQEYIRWLLPLINSPQVITLLSVLLLLCLVFGQFILRISGIERYLSSNFLVNISINGVAGLLFITFVLNVIAIFFIGRISLIILLIMAAPTAFILWKPKDFSSLFHKLKIANFSSHSILSYSVPLILIVFTLYHFSEAIEVMGWPAVGDTMLAHGPYTSLLVFNGKITLTLEPISTLPVVYPMGFHIVAANFVSWFDLLPGEAVFLLGGLLIILIPLILYSLTYLLTRSIPLSLLTYFGMFIVNPEYWHWGRWLMARFYAGPYPGLEGILIVIFSIVILSLEYAQPKKAKGEKLYAGSVLTLLLSLLVLILVYPPFTVFVGIMIVFTLTKHFGDIVIFIRKKPVLVILPFSYGLLFTLIPNSYFYTYSPERFVDLLVCTYTLQYDLPLTFFVNHITGYIMYVALLISLIFLLSRKYSLPSLFYITTLCVIIYAASPTAPTILYTILPGRAVMIPWIASWFILSLGIYEVFKTRILKKRCKRFINVAFVVILISFLMIPQFTSSIIQEFSYTNAHRWGWYTRSESFPYDYAALIWIYFNIPPTDLILIDRSMSSCWILSFSVKNVTFSSPWIMDSKQRDRMLYLEAIWNNPYDNNTVYQLLEKYNVSYIFVTSEYGYYLPKEDIGGFLHYVTRP
ncbi:MAG: hypothetical protein ACTSP1_19245, partial [Candidatus Freyarchaeota archaeon]